MMIFIWLIIGFVIYYLVKNSVETNCNGQSKKSSIEILQKRYVNGEIDDETYKRMLKLLND